MISHHLIIRTQTTKCAPCPVWLGVAGLVLFSGGCLADNPDFRPPVLLDGGWAAADLAGTPPVDLAGAPSRDLAGPPPPDFAVPPPDLAIPPPQGRVVLVPLGSNWRYLDNGSDQLAAWTPPAFDDANWKGGRAELGYGDGDEVTRVGFGPDPNRKYITTYFRIAFDAKDVAQVRRLDLRVKRDDGIVLHLNGFEASRDNMPNGAIDYRTLAVDALSAGEEAVLVSMSADPRRLVEGRNVIAAEVHQATSDSTDLSFDLELAATY